MNNRNALLEATKSLVAAKGVKATTVATIALRAGVAKGLLFYYFKDKEGIIQALADEVDCVYMAGLPSVPVSGAALDHLHALISHHFDFLAASPESAQFLYQSADASVGGRAKGFYEHLYARILDILKHGAQSGEFEALDMEELAYMLLGSLHGVGRLKLFEFKREYDAAGHLAAFYDKILLRNTTARSSVDS